MRAEHRAVFHLLAMGRVTPAQAERLLIAANDSQDTLWMLTAALILAFAALFDSGGLLGPLSLALNTALSISHAVIHQVIVAVSQSFGGMQ